MKKLKARWKRFLYLTLHGMWRGESAINVRDSKGLVTLASGAPTPLTFAMEKLSFVNYQIWWQRPLSDQNWPSSFLNPFSPQRIRWIETRGCMAEQDYKIRTGVVIKVMKNLPYPTNQVGPFLSIKMDDGEIIDFPKAAFTRAEDGVLEYRY